MYKNCHFYALEKEKPAHTAMWTGDIGGTERETIPDLVHLQGLEPWTP